jgi:Region found in RelA / SpoT proteins
MLALSPRETNIMANWASPSYSRAEVNEAGRILVNDSVPFGDLAGADNYGHALQIINNWRASHQYPLNTFQVTLRRKARSLHSNVLVSQRIKRLDSIRRKLSTTTIQLHQMQDIGGCRAVVDRPQHVIRLRDLYAESRFGHVLKNEKDYIQQPKDDGYRSVHMIYRYAGTENTHQYDNLQIEVQMRSTLQHAWATAVEAVGTFTKQALKWRGGDADWHRFFVLMSSAMANIEKCQLVDGTPKTRKELAAQLRELSTQLRVHDTLRAYSLTLNYVGGGLRQSDAKLLLVHMKPAENKVEVRGFRLRESQQANELYTALEEKIDPASADQAVLVSVDSLQALQRAYPNYFLDTARFASTLAEVLKWR